MKGLYNMSERSSEAVDDVEPTHIAATETPFPEKIWRVVSVPSNEVFNLPTLPKADRG